MRTVSTITNYPALTTKPRATKRSKTLKNMLGRKDSKTNKKKYSIEPSWLSLLQYLRREWLTPDSKSQNLLSKN